MLNNISTHIMAPRFEDLGCKYTLRDEITRHIRLKEPKTGYVTGSEQPILLAICYFISNCRLSVQKIKITMNIGSIHPCDQLP